MAAWLAGPLLAAEASKPSASAANDDDVVRLGKVVVAERGLGRAYFHVEVPGFEILSPFSAKLTKAYAHELQRQRQMLGLFVPAVGDSIYDAPQPIFLDDQPPPATANALYGRTYVLPAGVLTQSLNGIRGVPVKAWDRTPTADRSTIAWSRARSSDGVVFYTSVFGFDYARQSVGDQVVAADRGLNHIFPLPAVYEHRRPGWPEWLEDALDAFGGRFYSAQTLQVFMLLKLSAPPDDLGLERAFALRRAGDSLAELTLRRQATGVFVHWALVGGGDAMAGPDPRRDTFWRFVERAGREPVTAEMFARHFGPAAWDEVLRLWRKCAVRQTRPGLAQTLGTYWPQTQPTFAEAAVRPATRAELVRIKSEYEWRIGREFASAAPEIAQQCYAQAGWRLHHAYEEGERDPRFLAVLACYECDVGSPAAARKFVEEAVAARVVRPRVYFHQAQFRLADERARLATPETKLTLEQVRRVLEPLRIAQTQRPALSENYQLMAEAWLRSAATPEPDDLRDLAAGARLFPRELALACNVGLLQARSGDLAGAAEIAAAALPFVPAGSELLGRLEKLRDAANGPSRAATEKAGRE